MEGTGRSGNSIFCPWRVPCPHSMEGTFSFLSFPSKGRFLLALPIHLLVQGRGERAPSMKGNGRGWGGHTLGGAGQRSRPPSFERNQ